MTPPTPSDSTLATQLQAVATNAGDVTSYMAVTAAFYGVRASRKQSKKGN